MTLTVSLLWRRKRRSTRKAPDLRKLTALGKLQEKNRGQLEMYLVENAHEPIIDQKTFNRVQEMKGHIKHSVQMEQML